MLRNSWLESKVNNSFKIYPKTLFICTSKFYSVFQNLKINIFIHTEIIMRNKKQNKKKQ